MKPWIDLVAAKLSYTCSSLALFLFAISGYLIYFSNGKSAALYGGVFFLVSGVVALIPVVTSWFQPVNENRFPYWYVHLVFMVWMAVVLIRWVS